MEANQDLTTALALAREKQERLDRDVEQLDQEFELKKAQVDTATDRAKFESASRDAEWLQHRLEAARDAAKDHRDTELAPLETRHAAALIERETRAVQAARKEMEEAFAAAGQSIGAAIAMMEKAISSTVSFHGVRSSNPNAAFSRDGLKIDTLLALARASLNEAVRKDDMTGSGASLEFINTGSPGLLKLQVQLPAPIPAVMK